MSPVLGQGRQSLPAAPAHSLAGSGCTSHESSGSGLDLGARVLLGSTQARLGVLGDLSAILWEGGMQESGEGHPTLCGAVLTGQ